MKKCRASHPASVRTVAISKICGRLVRSVARRIENSADIIIYVLVLWRDLPVTILFVETVVMLIK
jgi:hypothetical protein